MAPFPLPVEALLTKGGAYFLYLLIGIGFGYALESLGLPTLPSWLASSISRI